MSNSNINFYFTCKQSGKHVIPQDWSDFIRLQADSVNYLQRTLTSLEYGAYRGNRFIPFKYWEDRNKFWEEAVGFEKFGTVNCTGVPVSTYLDTIRLFLKELRNHAAMQGDKETYQKARYNDEFFHLPTDNHNTIHTLLLTE